MTARRRVPEAANHASSDPSGIWGELTFDSVGRRAIYWRSRRARGGWASCVWKRYLPWSHRGMVPVGRFEPVRDS